MKSALARAASPPPAFQHGFAFSDDCGEASAGPLKRPSRRRRRPELSVQLWLWLTEESASGPTPTPKAVGPVRSPMLRVLMERMGARKEGNADRSVTVRPPPMTKEEREQLATLESLLAKEGISLNLPANFELCPPDEEPCVLVLCRHHNYLDVNEDNGAIKFNFPDLAPDEIPVTCSLRAANRDERGGAHTLYEVSNALNVTEERVRAIEKAGLRKIAALSPEVFMMLMERRNRAADEHHSRRK